jgi:hypothetical protein
LEAIAQEKESHVKVSSFTDAYATPPTTGTYSIERRLVRGGGLILTV